MAEEKGEIIADGVRRPSVTDGNCFGILRKGNREIVGRMVTGRDDPEYKMSHKYRGLALIFSHENFDYLEPRSEAKVDYENLKKVLDQLDFEVMPYIDLSYKEVEKQIAKAVGMDHTEHDCILVAILTQGESDMVWAKDKYYKVDNVWSAFTPDKCPTLAGKPKIFVVQVSRGGFFLTKYR